MAKISETTPHDRQFVIEVNNNELMMIVAALRDAQSKHYTEYGNAVLSDLRTKFADAETRHSLKWLIQ